MFWKWVIPIYSEDMDEDNFTPGEINVLIEMIREHDAFIISSPEHNAGPTAFFKNITDWLSRRAEKVMEDKPVLLLSTSPGRRGALSSRSYYEENLPRIGGKVVVSFGLPSFHHVMVDGKLLDEAQTSLEEAIRKFQEGL
ncbi:MAG: NAD(P)H-dependent oxidoreductase [Saprospiraceae bacterium]